MLLFISDLHLSPERPDITQAFFTFLKTTAADAETLYILGDFFDAWVGDDDDTPEYQQVAEALAEYQNQGHQLFFMHGNRDFMLGNNFAQRAGMVLLEDPTTITINQIPTLLMHGDSLCTQDEDYMAFRQMVRNDEWKRTISSKPLAERKALAAHLKSTSKSMNSLKAEDIMDVTPQEVVKVMSDNQVSLLIHGHTHRPARHPLTVNQKSAERIVLGDWHKQGWYLCADKGELNLRCFSV